MPTKFADWYAENEGRFRDRELAMEAWNAAIEAAASSKVHMASIESEIAGFRQGFGEQWPNALDRVWRAQSTLIRMLRERPSPRPTDS
jgi:hypothetical protein